MGKITIVKETKREFKTAPPPIDHGLNDVVDLHEWTTPEDWVDLYISRTAAKKMLTHCLSKAEERLEVMGLLIGDVREWKGKLYTIVTDTVTTETESTAIHVQFSKDAFGELMKELDKIKFDYILVGWYHSHPGHTSFLSVTDLETQRKQFNKPYQVALVIDPINKEMKAFKLWEHNYVEITYKICPDSMLTEYGYQPEENITPKIEQKPIETKPEVPSTQPSTKSTEPQKVEAQKVEVKEEDEIKGLPGEVEEIIRKHILCEKYHARVDLVIQKKEETPGADLPEDVKKIIMDDVNKQIEEQTKAAERKKQMQSKKDEKKTDKGKKRIELELMEKLNLKSLAEPDQKEVKK